MDAGMVQLHSATGCRALGRSGLEGTGERLVSEQQEERTVKRKEARKRDRMVRGVSGVLNAISEDVYCRRMIGE